jgi:hypothetical protein
MYHERNLKLVDISFHASAKIDLLDSGFKNKQGRQREGFHISPNIIVYGIFIYCYEFFN